MSNAFLPFFEKLRGQRNQAQEDAPAETASGAITTTAPQPEEAVQAVAETGTAPKRRQRETDNIEETPAVTKEQPAAVAGM